MKNNYCVKAAYLRYKKIYQNGYFQQFALLSQKKNIFTKVSIFINSCFSALQIVALFKSDDKNTTAYGLPRVISAFGINEIRAEKGTIIPVLREFF